MLNIVSLILAILFSLLSTTIIKINLVLLLVICSGINFGGIPALLFAFFSGLVFDLVAGQKIGTTGIFFLIVTFLVSLYRSKFHQAHILYLVPFTLFVLLIYNYLVLGNLLLISSFFYSLLIIPLNLLFIFIKDKSQRQEIEV